jgi:hypothetical protein
MTELKLTPKGKSYWDQNGAYHNEFDQLTESLMAPSGSSETLHGELIRACNRLVYEHCNNGNCNALNDDGYGISSFYAQFLNLIERSVAESSQYVEKVRSIIKADLYSDPSNFSDENMQAYANMCDVVVHYILNNEDSEIPSWYKKD